VISGAAVLAGTWLFLSGLSHGTPPSPSGAGLPVVVPSVGLGGGAASFDLAGRF
jgi:hypothetical protein